MHVLHPVPQAIDDELLRERVIRVDGVAGAAVVRVARQDCSDRADRTCGCRCRETTAWVQLVPFVCVIEHDVENHLDAGLVQRLDQVAKFVQHATSPSGLDAIAGMRAEESDRAVAPVVAIGSPAGFSATSESSNSQTGSSSTAVIPSAWRYGIFSIIPANVPGRATPALGERVKPPTCTS